MSKYKARVVTTADGGYQVKVWMGGVGFVDYGLVRESEREAIDLAQQYLAAIAHEPRVVWEGEV